MVRNSAVLIALALSALGCSAELEDYTADAESGSTHALISVERSTVVSSELAPRAGALVSIVRAPAAVDPSAVLNVVGMGGAEPEPGSCVAGVRERDPSTPLAPLGRVEFMDVGEVSVSVDQTQTTLAPRAFPTVTDLVSGVMYTTRDRSAEPLPAGSDYTVVARGNDSIPSLSVEARAPLDLSAVTLGGLPLADVQEVSLAQPIDLTWAVGDARDVVLVDVIGDDGRGVTCAFRDDMGAGSVPAGLVERGAGRIELHRVRRMPFVRAGVDRGELRFDFALSANISFSE